MVPRALPRFPPLFTFIMHAGLPPLLLAHTLDSLVRVSRRVGWAHFVNVHERCVGAPTLRRPASTRHLGVPQGTRLAGRKRRFAQPCGARFGPSVCSGSISGGCPAYHRHATNTTSLLLPHKLTLTHATRQVQPATLGRTPASSATTHEGSVHTNERPAVPRPECRACEYWTQSLPC
jgi:hypothetical protein